ncbi:DUF1365 domain-containing protein [Allofrancisella guangzhouensis]|uniref:DUF1365 domain-containing protein n=1 Tax=Allofrancisella guangzhouensis TaxID=594679 RepID=A0A0A8E6Y6_9GAMM|nr:DUF1365 domain-containing protein [Allofrancisella guangzhouensis]AJC49362.1 hypothetical protein SD28_06880 [Allofrancisella guangzhouensis]MBK2026997.1 DUF1365 domain-containing protein [Allofrancisella guangzhouensis]MBK2043905.1 DUF1365 domain-containing protein [Allofrancisella guangzhouensis]MBK2044982.1 DUF1365 domain-containing protein [Allofrancisella guangzhouensis]
MVKNFVLSSKIFHKRHYPKQNSFCYNSYYIIVDMLDINKNKLNIFSINKFNLYSFYDKDHGYRNNKNSLSWIANLLQKYKLDYDDIRLLTMPRLLGYLFNPVSFWLCYNNEKLIAIIAEVNNTFGETHSYVCHKNGTQITKDSWFEAQKEFHVSPFYQRRGFYRFNFDINLKNNTKSQITINYYDNNKLQLNTQINGISKAFSNMNLLKEFLRSPLLTFKVIFLIHYQALKILLKRIKYVSKPTQINSRITEAKYINKI